MHESWKSKLAPLKSLVVKIYSSIEKGDIVYPPIQQSFAAFDMPFDNVKVIIIGQDPYHGEGQANGLAFSVNKGIVIPPSLMNIYKELNNDLGIEIPDHGDLSNWVDQGVLLVNSSLTVKHKSPGSHSAFGWHEFVHNLLNILAEEKDCLIFILWGKHAIDLVQDIDLHKHYVIKSSHPSPFSANRSFGSVQAFFGSKPFSECNNLLQSCNKKVINWKIE